MTLRRAAFHSTTFASARCEDLEQVGRNPGCLLSMIEDWVASHDGRARVVSEVVWPGRSHAEAVEALRHEALVNHALAGSGATIMSPFDAGQLDADILAAVEMTHLTVVEETRVRHRLLEPRA